MAQTSLTRSKFQKHPKLIVDNLDYCLRGKSNDAIHWSCAIKGCPATARTNLDMEDFVLRRPHNHTQRELKLLANEFRNEMKRLAKTTNDTPLLIYSTVLEKVPVLVQPLIGHKDTCLKDIRRQRQKVFIFLFIFD